MMPWRLAYWPVRIEARLGEHSGVGVERRGEHRALVADAIDMRRLHVGMAADPQLVEPEVVDQDDQEVGFALLCHDEIPALESAKHAACRNEASDRS
jgi:hypothetical protein